MGWMFSACLFAFWVMYSENWYLLIASGLFAIAGAIAWNCGK